MKKNHVGWKEALAIVIAFALSFVIILAVFMPEGYDFSVGDICTVDIYAPRDIEDRVTTESRRRVASEKVTPQYRVDYAMKEEAVQLFEDMAKQVGQERRAWKEGVASSSDTVLPDAVHAALLSMDEAAYQEFIGALGTVFTAQMEHGVRDKTQAIDGMELVLSEGGMSGEEIALAGEILKLYTKINEIYDEELTEAERERVRQNVEPEIYKKNAIIVRRGEEITEKQYAMLADLGLIKGERSVNFQYAMGILLLLTTMYGMAVYFMCSKPYRREIKFAKLVLALLFTVMMLLIVALCRKIPVAYIYAIPLPLCAILMATFVSVRMSAVSTLYICFAAAIMLGQDETFVLFMITASMFASIIFKQVSSLSGYVRAMAGTILLMALMAVMVMLLSGKPYQEVLYCGLFGGLNGVISSLLAIGTTPIFENLFNVTTPFKLNDLGNPEKPLLKRMMIEAPGTYHHSLMVGNLAEAACLKIGANNQLARVAAYYHDIGKLKRPDYFFENQIGDNPHDALMPEESAAVLKNHVMYGQEVARQYRLPEEIREVIAQHHGTTMTGIFYRKAKEMNLNPDEELFRYPGPKPESKEAGIVMLADSCEAAVRSLDEKTEPAIRNLVTKIVKGRMTDGELDRCNLSFRELGEIIDAFVAVQSSYFHKRIKYDKEQENEPDNQQRNSGQ